jgi:hypothetical protein
MAECSTPVWKVHKPLLKDQKNKLAYAQPRPQMVAAWSNGTMSIDVMAFLGEKTTSLMLVRGTLPEQKAFALYLAIDCS